MHSLIIILNSSTTNLALSYKELHKALASSDVIDRAMNLNGDRVVSLEDDYGRRVSIDIRCVSAYILGDLEKDMESSTEQQTIKARAEQKFRVKMANDPVHKLVGAMQ